MFLFFLEVVYLVECGKIEVRDGKRKFLFEEIMNFGRVRDEFFDVKYFVYKDLRDRGYIVKFGLKFGFYFRVYWRGMEEYFEWFVWVVFENFRLSLNDIIVCVRVVYGVRKNMIMVIVDEDVDVIYYKVEWVKF